MKLVTGNLYKVSPKLPDNIMYFFSPTFSYRNTVHSHKTIKTIKDATLVMFIKEVSQEEYNLIFYDNKFWEVHKFRIKYEEV